MQPGFFSSGPIEAIKGIIFFFIVLTGTSLELVAFFVTQRQCILSFVFCDIAFSNHLLTTS